jgi:pimeloyl-ACP methyl ester carboxylesterase
MTALHTENLAIASDTPGISLHLRHKRRADIAQFGPERTVLLMHGATLPAESLFDVQVGQGAFMDVLAEAGFDVYALNVRGFGASTRPPGMEGAPDAAPPQVRTEVAVRDLGAAVAHILAAHALPQLVLIGMSWGGTVTGAYTAAHPEHIAKLVLIAPQWLSDGPPRIDPGGPLQAYRRFDVRAFHARWLESVPPHRHEEILPPTWFERWVDIMLASDPAESGGIIRAPAGVIQDVREYWAVGRPFYDPGAITAPVLLLHAEWDLDVPQPRMAALFQRLSQARYRRWIEIGEGTHMVVMEKNRWQVLQEILNFLMTNPYKDQQRP